jgi:glycosyltransferase involved in cell wall biosynthesis
MPVYNEADAIPGVIAELLRVLDGLSCEYEVRVYNDGSSDGSSAILHELGGSRGDRLMVIDKPNEGHGPTILRGYREAVGTWVFQTDSDNEIPFEPLTELWARRDEFDLLLGWRENRVSTPGRRMISAVARHLVARAFAPGVRDVNVPFRLMRRDALQALLAYIPPDTFAPNVALSGLALIEGLRLYQCPVPHEPRRTGTVSITKLRLWRAAATAFFQTAAIARAARKRTE